MDVIAQILSIISCVAIIFSFQLKNNRHLFLVQTFAALSFGLSYLLLGALDGFLINTVCFINTAVLLKKKLKKTPVLIAICVAFIVISTISPLTYNGVWGTQKILETVFSYLIAIAQILYTIATWKDDGGKIRTVRMFFVTPAWLGYNIVVFSIGGIICELFNVISIIVSFIRYGKNGFEK
ncbi:MAG: YgjV family protein [Clostridia bacterium]|nr:YgjV family protein [Clostridia bacterium]